MNEAFRDANPKVLPDYTSSTYLGEQIAKGEDLVHILVVSGGRTKDYTLSEYCDGKIGTSDDVGEFHEEMLKKQYLAAQVLSGISIEHTDAEKLEIHNYTYSVRYNEDKPPEFKENKLITSHEKEVLGISGPVPQPVPRSYGTAAIIPETDPDAVLRGFAEFQHKGFLRKRLLCTTVKELLGRYVDPNGISGKILPLLREGKSVLVHGSGGMGKSTLAYMLYETMYGEYEADRSRPVPILVSPRVFAGGGPESGDLIAAVMRDSKFQQEQVRDTSGIRRDGVILFIDAIDEYLRPGSEDLDNLMVYTDGYRMLVTGRTEIRRDISGDFEENQVFDLDGSVGEQTVIDIYDRYLNGSADGARDLIDSLNGMDSAPLIAAMTATYLSDNPSVDYVNGRPVRGSLYKYLISRILEDRFRTESDPEDAVSDGMRILSEYAWLRSLYPGMDYGERVRQTAERTGSDRKVCKKVIDKFTDSGNPDRPFLHTSVQDYLLARWIVDQSSADAPDGCFMEVMFPTDVQRFLGDIIRVTPGLAVRIVDFCKRMIAESESKGQMKDNYQTKMMYMMARGAMVGDIKSAEAVKRYFGKIINENEPSPQLAVALLCAAMLGDMSAEGLYYEDLHQDRFAEIVRAMYMIYMGDLGPNEPEFRDVRGGYFDSTARRYLEDIGERNLRRDNRSKYLCRTQTTLVRTFLKKGYLLRDKDILLRISSIDPGEVLGNVFVPKFEENLKKQGADPAVYRKILSDELDRLRTIAGSMVADSGFAKLFRSAEDGDADSQFELGMAYADGTRGAQQSDMMALKWFRRAAKQDNADAQFMLGTMYEEGRGVPQFDDRAVELYCEALASGRRDAIDRLILLADRDCVSAQRALVETYWGEGSYGEAMKWTCRMADMDADEALFHLLVVCQSGEGGPESVRTAADWFRGAAERGIVTAQNCLGMLFENGRGVQQSDAEAAKWWRKAADQGHWDAQYHLGLAYYNGEGVQQSYAEALKWWMKAADQDHLEAQCRLGLMYRDGIGVEQSYAEAEKWFRKAADQGSEEAQLALDSICE